MFNPISPEASTYYCLNVTDSSPLSINSLPSYVAVTPLVIPSNNTPVVKTPSPVTSCHITYNSIAANQMLVCTGNDVSGAVTGWNLQVYNESSIQLPLIISNNNTGSTYYYQNDTGTIINNITSYTAILTWTGTTSTKYPNGSISSQIFRGTQSFQFPIQPKPGFNSTLNGFMVLIIMLIFLGIGIGLAQTPGGQVHGISNTLFIMAFGVFLCIMLGFLGGISVLYGSGIIVFLILIGLFTMVQENKSQYYSG